jgi:hypothetical protein
MSERATTWLQDGIDSGWFSSKAIGSIRNNTSYRVGGWWFLPAWLPDSREYDVGPFKTKREAIAMAEQMVAERAAVMKLTNDRLWWLKKFSTGGWTHGYPMFIGIKKWDAHTAVLVKMGLLEKDQDGSDLCRITDAGLSALQAEGDKP